MTSPVLIGSRYDTLVEQMLDGMRDGSVSRSEEYLTAFCSLCRTFYEGPTIIASREENLITEHIYFHPTCLEKRSIYQ